MSALSAQDIAKTVNGELQGDPKALVDGAAGLNEATEAQISFFHNMKYVASLGTTKAKVIIIPRTTNGTPLPEGKTWIRVDNPQWAFAQVLGVIERTRQRHPKGISTQTQIDPTAKVGENVSVGAFTVIEAGAVIESGSVIYSNCYIGANVHIGRDALIYSNVSLREGTVVGDRAIIHSGTVLGSDGYGFATLEGKHHKIPQIGIVVVENDVEIGANVAIDRATTGQTLIGEGTKIDNLVHIAHNVQIGPGCLITAQVGFAGSTKVGDHVTFGGQAGIVGHITIGAGAIIAAQTGVMSDVEPKAVLFGSPARPIKEAMKLEAIFGKLPEIYATIRDVRKKMLS